MKSLNLAIATIALVAVASTSAFAFGPGGDRETSSNAAISATNTYNGSAANELPAQPLSASDSLLFKLDAPHQNEHASSN